jgi:hypothetical protein
MQGSASLQKVVRSCWVLCRRPCSMQKAGRRTRVIRVADLGGERRRGGGLGGRVRCKGQGPMRAASPLVIRARTARPRASLVAGVLKLRPLWLDQNAKGKPQLHIEATPLPACQPQWQTLLCAAAIGGPSRNSLLTVLPRFGRRSFLDETGRLRCSAGHNCIRKAWWDRAEAAKMLPPTR